MTQLERIAHHEAGHAVADLVLGHGPQLVSIRATDRYAAICRSKERELPAELLMVAAVSQQPIALRNFIESEVIATLAGPAASDLFWPQTGYVPPHPDEERAERMVAQLGPRHRELLLELEIDRTPLMSDDDKAIQQTAAFAGEAQGLAYYRWLRAAARDLVIEHSIAIHAVAKVLLEKTVLAGDEIAANAKGARWKGSA